MQVNMAILMIIFGAILLAGMFFQVVSVYINIWIIKKFYFKFAVSTKSSILTLFVLFRAVLFFWLGFSMQLLSGDG